MRRHTTREILIGQIISVIGSIVAGVTLELTKGQLITVTGVFLLLPGVFDLGGSVAGAMAARISHRLQEGEPTSVVLRSSFLHAVALLVSASFFLGLFGASLASIFFAASFLKVLLIAIFSTILAGLIGFPIVARATLLAHRKTSDPDNFIGPIETSIFDTLTLLSVTLAVVLLR